MIDVGDYVHADLGHGVEIDGVVEASKDGPLGGKILSVRKDNSELIDMHENLCQVIVDPRPPAAKALPKVTAAVNHLRAAESYIAEARDLLADYEMGHRVLALALEQIRAERLSLDELRKLVREYLTGGAEELLDAP